MPGWSIAIGGTGVACSPPLVHLRAAAAVLPVPRRHPCLPLEGPYLRNHSGHLPPTALHRSLIAILPGAWASNHPSVSFCMCSKNLGPLPSRWRHLRFRAFLGGIHWGPLARFNLIFFPISFFVTNNGGLRGDVSHLQELRHRSGRRDPIDEPVSVRRGHQNSELKTPIVRELGHVTRSTLTAPAARGNCWSFFF